MLFAGQSMVRFFTFDTDFGAALRTVKFCLAQAIPFGANGTDNPRPKPIHFAQRLALTAVSVLEPVSAVGARAEYNSTAMVGNVVLEVMFHVQEVDFGLQVLY